MNAVVYYFTGTGNSLMLARGIAEGLQATLIPLAPLARMDTIMVDTDIDVVGIVFPVYYADAPVIIKQFARKLVLDGLEKRYIFAVCNYGGATGSSLKTLGRIIRSRGGTLSGAYGIHMPQNAFLKKWEKHEKIYKNAMGKIDTIVRNTITRKRAYFLASVIPNALLAPLTLIVKPLTRRFMAKATGEPKGRTLDELIPMIDRSFKIDEDRCTYCGLCTKVCPVNNIEMAEMKKRPVWLNHCENCLACYNWCPVKAIRGGVAQEGYYYRHPDVKVADMIVQKGGEVHGNG